MQDRVHTYIKKKEKKLWMQTTQIYMLSFIFKNKRTFKERWLSTLSQLTFAFLLICSEEKNTQFCREDFGLFDPKPEVSSLFKSIPNSDAEWYYGDDYYFLPSIFTILTQIMPDSV